MSAIIRNQHASDPGTDSEGSGGGAPASYGGRAPAGGRGAAGGVPLSAVNFHVIQACDARCDFCFATFRGVRGRLAAPDALRLITLLRAHGAEKLTFAGGEPTLHPDLEGYLRHAKAEGFVTGVVTNGSRLRPLLERAAGALDWVALSIDSASEATQRALGRGDGDHLARAVQLSDLCRDAGVRLKVNTVVTSLTWQEDLTELVRRVAPERWKLFQVLRVEGQNDGRVERLLISREQFSSFVARHAGLAAEGVTLVPEDNDAMTDSYVMVDPLGRFYGDTGGRHRVGPAILEAGVDVALAAVGYRHEKLRARGGLYDWAPARRHRSILDGRATRAPREGAAATSRGSASGARPGRTSLR